MTDNEVQQPTEGDLRKKHGDWMFPVTYVEPEDLRE